MAGGAARLSNPVDLGKVIATDLLMEGLMMAIGDAKEILSVEAIIAKSLVFISTRKTTAVMILPPFLKDLNQSFYQGLFWSLLQVSVAGVVITRLAEDAALLRTHVAKEKGIVMEQEMEELTMETEDAKGISCVAATTARSLVSTTTRKTTAVKGQQVDLYPSHQTDKDQAGDLGAIGAIAEGEEDKQEPVLEQKQERRNAKGGFVVLTMEELDQLTHKRDIATQRSEINKDECQFLFLNK
eukprot:GFUD01088142.1.p2 GENE.GFUD01088142.1~~GFUD01088142.1.p2  ORF type:complete len:241 (-),score=49.69 GFUD01088142.1:38-760(-)